MAHPWQPSSYADCHDPEGPIRGSQSDTADAGDRARTAKHVWRHQFRAESVLRRRCPARLPYVSGSRNSLVAIILRQRGPVVRPAFSAGLRCVTDQTTRGRRGVSDPPPERVSRFPSPRLGSLTPRCRRTCGPCMCTPTGSSSVALPFASPSRREARVHVGGAMRRTHGHAIT